MVNPNLVDDEDIPDWISTLAAAKWIGCPPWELENQPKIWKAWILAYMQASAVTKNSPEE